MPKDDDNECNTIDSSVALYGWKDDKRPLPFVQLGDVFVRDTQSWVFAVVNASCDLQIVPANVSQVRNNKKGRTRNRTDTVLLLPGEVCELGTTTPDSLTTELFAISGKYYAVKWKPKQIVSIPHCCLRTQLQDREYLHNVRLQMDRAIELQQEAFVSNSRVGLEVQPQLSRTVSARIYVKQQGAFHVFGDDIESAGGVFHTRNKMVLVVNHNCLVEIKQRLDANQHSDFSQGKQQFEDNYAALHRCPFEVKHDSRPVLKIIRPNNAIVSCKRIRVGFTAKEVVDANDLDAQIYFHFFYQKPSNAN